MQNRHTSPVTFQLRNEDHESIRDFLAFLADNHLGPATLPLAAKQAFSAWLKLRLEQVGTLKGQALRRKYEAATGIADPSTKLAFAVHDAWTGHTGIKQAIIEAGPGILLPNDLATPPRPIPLHP